MKHYLLISISIFAVSFVFAEERNMNEVLDNFYATAYQDSICTHKNADNLNIIPYSRNGETYIYLISDDKKTVFVSNEKQYSAIIGYSNKKTTPEDTVSMPPALKLLLSHHMNMIDSLRRDSPKVFYSRANDTKQSLNRSQTDYVIGDYL